MNEPRKLEIRLTDGSTDHLTDVDLLRHNGKWIYCYLPEGHKVTYRADGIVRIYSSPMVYE